MRGKPKILLASNLLAGYSWPFIIAQACGALLLGFLFLFFGQIILKLLGFAIGFLLIGTVVFIMIPLWLYKHQKLKNESAESQQ